MGTALLDVTQTMITCKLFEIAYKLQRYIDDLLDCIEGDCFNFVIDFVLEVIIIYKNRYEIYGDIHGAINSFQLLEAYQQGGLCIGRLVRACLNINDELDGLYIASEQVQLIEQ